MKQKGIALLVVVLIIVGIAAIGGGGYYYFYLKPSKTQTTISTIAKPSDQTLNWQVYNNTTYNYSIKYPQDWYFHQTGFNPPPPAGIFLANKPEGTVPEGRTTYPYTSFTVSVDQSMGRTLANYEEISNLVTQGYQKSSEMVSGEQAVRVTQADTKGHVISIYVKHGDYIYRLGWQMPPDDNSQSATCEKILQTFTFTS